MGFDFYFTLILFLLLSILLVKEWLKPEIAIFSALILLIVFDVISVKEAFSGFSNVGMLTIALLFIVAGSLQVTGALEKITNILFSSKKLPLPLRLLRLLIPISFFSAFLNNTPIVAMLIPGTKSWAEKEGEALSKYLIPISYAAILGGMCTLIGTSTNLILNGLLIESNAIEISFFEFAKIGIPATIIGIIYLVFFGHRLLPEKKAPMQELGLNTREYVIELKVAPDYQQIGKSIEEAGLRHLTGLYLFQIEREGEILSSISPAEIIKENDRLFFTGLPKTILEIQKTPGLILLNDSHFDLKQYDSEKIKTYEAVVSADSHLVGKNVRESRFRSRYGGVIIAIHRNGERIRMKIGNVVIKPGDTLLILADKSFIQKWYHSSEFYLISSYEEVDSKPGWHAYFSASVFLLMIILGSLDIIPLVSAMGAAAILLILFGSISGSRAVTMVDWRVLLVIASSFGIAVAMEKSGVGSFFAHEFIQLFHPLGIYGIIAALYCITALYTNFITNNTAAVLLFPIALNIAGELDTNILPFIVAIAIGASSSFATPISYQTNLMVYGPGSYKFTDFLRVGIPLQIIIAIVTILLIGYFYF